MAGHRLLAVDGSVTQLPISNELLEHFGKARPHAAMPHVRLSQLYDVKNNMTLDLRVESHSTGELEVLVSSLTDLKAYPTSLFVNLYHQRRGVEEDYKVLKSRLNIENYSSVSVEGILQDLHAKLLTKNLASSAIHDAKRKIKKPHLRDSLNTKADVISYFYNGSYSDKTLIKDPKYYLTFTSYGR